MVALTTYQVSNLTTATLKALTTGQVVAIETTDIRALTTGQMSAIATSTVAALSTDQIQALQTNQLSALSTSGVRALTTEQVAALSTSQVTGLSTRTVQALSTSAIAALSTDQIGAINTAGLAALTTSQVTALSTDALVALTTYQIQAISTSGMKALSTDQIVAIETTDIAVLTTKQLSALSTSQTYSFTTTQVEALQSSQIAAFGTEAYQYLTTGTPIILDLNGDGVRTQSIDAGVKFDLFDDGAAINTGWVSSGDGLLVLDRNQDGQINDGSELFGSATRLSNGEKASDGYAALRELDSNGDGVISSDDAIYGDLRIWIDSNSDGVSGTGETKTLAELGIAKINLNAVVGTDTDNGNILGLTSSYETTDGVTHDAADVWFLANRTPVAGEASSVDSAIAALNTTTTVPTLAVDPVAVPQTQTVPTIQAQPAVEPVPLTSAMRAQVSSMAQAMGSFVEAGLSQPELAAASADGAAAAPTLSPVALAVTSLADAMKQFDVNGPALGGQSSLGVPTTTLKLSGIQDPNAGDMLTTGGKT